MKQTFAVCRITLVSLLLLLTVACSNEDQGMALPETLRIGILPDESESQLRTTYSPLFDYVAGKAGVGYEFVIPESYDALVIALANKEVDLAYFGGVTYLLAKERHGAIPLVMRDKDLRFTSYFLVRADDPGKKISDFKDRALSFGSKLSTSGHLMPRYFLGKLGIDPEGFFSRIEYSGKHDATAYMVRDSKVDIGAANSSIISKMYNDGRLDPKDVRIIYETPPYADYVWAIRPGFSNNAREKIVNAFLSLSPVNDTHAAILKAVNAGGYLPASDNDYSELTGIFYQLGFNE